MPTKPANQCPGAGQHYHSCSNLAHGRYCIRCAEIVRQNQKKLNRGYDQSRDRDKDRHFLHSVSWRKMRLNKLAINPLCEICLVNGREIRAVLVHHIDQNELNNSANNHQSLCNVCHEQIHRKERWKNVSSQSKSETAKKCPGE